VRLKGRLEGRERAREAGRMAGDHHGNMAAKTERGVGWRWREELTGGPVMVVKERRGIVGPRR
jgi:hypothetical protein